MEILLGTSLLLQVLVLIQIMRMGRQVLQQIKRIEHSEMNLREAGVAGENALEPEIANVHRLRKNETYEEKNIQKKEGMVKKEEQEVLINEVLSEFF